MSFHRLLWSACLVVSMADPVVAQDTRPLLADVFTDHAVLQRDQPVRVFGFGRAGDTVTVTLGQQSANGVADASGAWSVTLKPMSAGGPHTLTARAASGATQTINDVLVGDVWLCSGQSNMEWPVSQTLNGAYEAARSTNDSIRLLSIARDHAPAPRQRFGKPVLWAAARPATVADFSGTCYYFARDLQQAARVPMGLIHSSWGGSNIETWISSSGLRAVGGFDTALDLLHEYSKSPADATGRLGTTWEAWWRTKVPDSEPWQPAMTAGWREAPAALGDWKEWKIPELANFHGMVWYRRSVTLTKAQAAGRSTLSLGRIDEVDQTWVNGRAVGNTFGWGTERVYDLPAGALREGTNVVVVNVLNNWAVGGLLGPAETMSLRLADGSSVPLAGQWQYQTAPKEAGQPPRAPWHSIGGFTTLYNAMVAPLGPVTLRGALWYQGESNAAAADAYEKLLVGLMADWRSRFGADLPFLVVQLPNFGIPAAEPVESDWASLRDAQRRATARDPHAALAVTIDIGDRFELHPPNKQQVGIRLARAARHIVYGETITPSGPRAVRVERGNGTLIVTFDDVEKTLVAFSATQPVGFEVCGAGPGSCRFASATIEGTRVIVAGPEVATATRVRYCWGDAPICNLSDGSALPAGPFELAVDTTQSALR